MRTFESKSGLGCNWEPLDSQLPMTKHDKSSGCLSVFFLLFGLTFAGIPTSILLLDPSSVKDELTLILLLGMFTLIGLGVVGLGIYSFLFKAITTIDGSTVHYAQHGLTPKKWRESLANYHGILRHSRYVSGGKNSSGYMVYEVSLIHSRDKDRNVLLHESRSSTDLNERWEHFSRVLQLPALEESVDGYKITRFGETRSQNVPPPESGISHVTDLPRKLGGFRVENHHGGKRLRFYRGAVFFRALFPMLFGAFFGGMPLWIYLFKDQTSFLFLFIGIGGLMFFGGILWMFCLLISSEVLEVQLNGVRHYIAYPWGPQWEKRLQREEIEEVSVRKILESRSSTAFQLRIKSSGGTIVIDGRLSDDEKVRLRDFLNTRFDLKATDSQGKAI